MKLFFKIIIKLISVIALPPFLLFVFAYGLIMLVINAIALCRDKNSLDYTETERRKTDRENSCLHECAKLFLDYIKFLFLDWS